MNKIQHYRKYSNGMDSMWRIWKNRWKRQGFPYCESGDFGENGIEEIDWRNSLNRLISKSSTLMVNENITYGKSHTHRI